MPEILSHKFCSKCKDPKPSQAFYKDTHSASGLTCQCRDCLNIQQEKYRQSPHGIAKRTAWVKSDNGKACLNRGRKKFESTEKGKLARRQIVLRHQRRHPDRAKARRQLNNAAARGKIARPKECEQCCQGGRIEAHHHKGYAPEFWLDVLWLCCSCHKKANG